MYVCMYNVGNISLSMCVCMCKCILCMAIHERVYIIYVYVYGHQHIMSSSYIFYHPLQQDDQRQKVFLN